MNLRTLLAFAATSSLICVPLRGNAEIITNLFSGTVTNVYAGIDPLWDPVPPYFLPDPDASFQQHLLPGQKVFAKVSYNSEAEDWYDKQVIESSRIGIYDAIVAGEVSIAGISYSLEAGDVSIELDNSRSEDQVSFNATGYQVITNPIAATGVNLIFGVAAPGLFDSDSLPTKVPLEWTRGQGHLSFFSGVAGLKYSVQFTVDTLHAIPEPSTATILIGILAALGTPIARPAFRPSSCHRVN